MVDVAVPAPIASLSDCAALTLCTVTNNDVQHRRVIRQEDVRALATLISSHLLHLSVLLRRQIAGNKIKFGIA